MGINLEGDAFEWVCVRCGARVLVPKWDFTKPTDQARMALDILLADGKDRGPTGLEQDVTFHNLWVG